MNRPPVPRPGNRDVSPAAALAALAAAAAVAVRRKVDASLVAAIDARGFEAVRARIERMSSPCVRAGSPSRAHGECLQHPSIRRRG